MSDESGRYIKDPSKSFFKVEIKAARKTTKDELKPKQGKLTGARYSESQERFYIPDPDDFIQYVESQEGRKQSHSYLFLDRKLNQPPFRESLVTEEAKPSQSRLTYNNTPANGVKVGTNLNTSLSDLSI